MVLVTIGAVLPLALVIVLGVSRLLVAMQDTAAATVLDRIALATALVWGIDLVTLILALGINAIGPTD
jgi:hypothetical protein